MSDYRDGECLGVGRIHNTYGGLNIAEWGGKYYWSIKDCNGHYWENIPKYLYDALIKFEEERNNG